MAQANFIQARWAVAALFTANGFLMGAWAPQIPLLLPRHQIGEAVLGLMILALGLGAVGAMLFSGKLLARFGSRRVALGFGALCVPMLPLIVMAPSVATASIAMACFGAVIGSMDVAMNAHAVTVERGLGRAIMSSSHGFWSLGGFVGGSAGSYMIEKVGAVEQSLVAAGLVAILVIVAAPFLIQDPALQARTKAQTTDTAPDTAPDTAARARMLPRSASLWILGFMALFCMVPEGSVFDWAAIYLTKTFGSDLFVSGLPFALFAGAMAVMRFAGDGVRNRFGAVRTFRVSALIGAVGLLAGACAPNDWVVILAFGFAGLGIANLVPILFSAAGNHPGLTPGAGISTVTMVGYAGILVAPSAIGFVAEHVGFRPTYAALAVILGVVALMAPRAAAADGVALPDPAAAQPHAPM
jgi:MFS family permease